MQVPLTSRAHRWHSSVPRTQQCKVVRLPVRTFAFLNLSELEQDRRAHRTVYDHTHWQKHRSPLRLVDRLLSIPASVILKNVLPTVAWVATVSCALVAYACGQQAGVLPAAWPAFEPSRWCQAFTSHTAVALSLLLVFRTNNGYGRWDEARKMWGMLVNRSRDLARMTSTLFPETAFTARMAMMRWLVAFTRLLRIFLQPELTIDNSDLKEILTPSELELLRRAKNPQAKAIQVMSEIVHSTLDNPMQQLQMSQNLTQYHDILGGCERLLRAPIPVSYTRHTARFLFCWLTLLPFTLPAAPWQIPAVAGIAMVLAAIEEIGVQCEEPFGILPLERISERIKGDVVDTIQDDDMMRQVLRDSMGLQRGGLGNTTEAGVSMMDVLSVNGSKQTVPVYAN